MLYQEIAEFDRMQKCDKEEHMGTKDVSAREFIADNRRFADDLYAGRRVIVP